MAPKKPPTRKQQEKDEQDRLQQEKEKQEQLDRIRAEREREQQEAEELARLELLRKSRLPDEAFRFRVNAVGWKQGNPPPRYHHVAVDLEGRLVVLAGCRGERLDSAYILDTDTKRWSQRPLAGSPPETYACHSYVLWNGTLYLYGGYGETGFKQDLFLLNLTGDWAWQKLQTSGDLPPFYGMSTVLAAEGGKMICFGGRANTQTLSNDTYVLDLGTFFWTKLTTGGTAPSARFSHCAAVHSNRMLVHGGIDALGSVEPTAAREDNSHIYALDLETLQWSVQPVRGKWLSAGKVYGHTMTKFKNGLLVLCGHRNSEAHVLNLDTWKWTQVPTQGEAITDRLYHAALYFAPRDVVVVFGGQTVQDKRECADTYFLTIARQ